MNENAQPFLGMWTGFGVEYGSDLGGDERLQILFGDEVACVLLEVLEVKLTALPRAGVAGGAQSGFEPGMGFREMRLGTIPCSLRAMRNSRQWTSASDNAQLTPRIMRLPSSRRMLMALSVA